MKKEAKHTPGPILNDGETPKGLMPLAGPKHYECAVREIECLAARLGAETSNARGEVEYEYEYEYEVWQDGVLQAGGREADYASAQFEARHYAAMYTPDGPVEVRIYEKRLLSTTQAQPKRRPYNVSGSLSEYGVFPECDAAPAAQTPRACTCHPDDRPDGPCRERYAASECQALAAQEQAERLREALKEIRSRSCMNLAMNPNPYALTALLGDIHQIADAALAKEDE